MNKKRKLDAIVATYSSKSQAFFSSSSKPGKDYDYVKTYLNHASFDLFAVHNIPPENGNDAKQSRTGSAGQARIGGESTLRVRMGTVSGYLMLCPEMIYDQFDPLAVCDDHSAELEYVMSALSDAAGPLNSETGEPLQNVFYIENLEIDPAYKTQRLGSRIIRELPYLVREFMHVFPDVLAYRPAPLANEWDDVSERVNALRGFAMERLSNRIEMMLNEKEASQDGRLGEKAARSGKSGGAGSGKLAEAAKSSEALPAGDGKHVATISITLPEYDFSDDEINLIMGRRSSLSEYPEWLKDLELFRFYERTGFREIPGSRLLYRKTL